MNNTTKKSFNKRAFVTLTATSAGLGLPITGLANHLFQMEPMGFTRHAWMAAHTGLGILCSIFVIWHIIFNYRAFFNYVGRLGSQRPGLNREVFWAVVLVGAVLVIAVGHALI